MKKILITFLLFITSIQFVSTFEIDRTELFKQISWMSVQEQQQNFRESILTDIYIRTGITFHESVNIDHIEFIYTTARDMQLPIDLVFRLVQQESRFNSSAISHKGAYGYMQLMPATYAYYHIKLFGEDFIEDHNPYKNIYIGLYMLKELYKYWNNWSLTLASYNAGIGRVKQYNGVPPFSETRNYIKIILWT